MASPVNGVEAVDAKPKDAFDSDPIWSSSSTARQIHALGTVEEEIATLLQLAASAMRLLAVPSSAEATQDPDAALQESQSDPFLGVTLTPKEEASSGEERSELFVEKANQYFDTLDSIQHSLRRALYDLRQKKISPSSIVAPPANFVPQGLGVGPSSTPVSSLNGGNELGSNQPSGFAEKYGLQEMRAEKAAWLGMTKALVSLSETEASMAQNTYPNQNKPASHSDSDTEMNL